MNNKILRILLLALLPLLLLIMPSPAYAAGCGNFPSGAVYCQQLSVQNSQSSATTANTQIMVNYNALEYQSYLAENLMNIEAYNSISGAIIPMWLEGNSLNEQQASNLYSSANIILWLKLPDVIAASSTDSNIYLAYFHTTTDEFSATGNYGAAPQLFCASGCPASSYAGADNGANVFPFYDNFLGTTLNSKWTSYASATYSVNNGLTMSAGGIYASYSDSANSIFEIYGYSTSSSNWGLTGFSGTTTASGDGSLQDGYFNYRNNNINGYKNVGGTETEIIGPTGATLTADAYYLRSFWYNGATVYYSENYGSSYSASDSTYSSTSYIYMVAEVSTFTQYVRTRIIPPNGVLPSVSFGAVQPVPVSLSISPNPATYGQSITITATCPNSADTCAVDYPSLGTHLAQATGSATYTYNPFVLAAGTYSYFYANDITQGTNSIPQTLTVNQNSTYKFTLASCGTQVYPYSCNTVGTIKTYSNQVIASLYLNNNLLGTTNSVISNTISNTIGYFPYTFNTLGNGNYIAQSLSSTFLLYEPIYASNVLPTGTVSTKTIDSSYLTTPYTWNTFYPIKIYTTSPSNTLEYTLSQTLGSTQALLANNALNLSYVPPANQVTGNYIYQITEGQLQNPQTLTFTIAANTLNMTDINSAINYSSLYQYFPILAHTPTWTVKPASWYILSSNSVPQITQNTSAGAVFSTNVVGSFTPQIYLKYPFASAFLLNYTNNPKVQNSITIQPFLFVMANSISSSLRDIANLTVYNQETFNSIAGANVTFNISTTFNNYLFSKIISNNTDTNGKYFLEILKSNYQNPNITFQLNGTISKPLFFAPAQLFCPSTVAYGSSANYQIGLVDTNGTKYSFYVYTNTGSSAAGYILFINELQGVSARGAESLVVPPSLPMAVPLEQTGQEYQYIIYSPNCKSVYYKGSFVDPTNPTYLTLTTGASQAVFYNTTNVTGACALNSSTNPYKVVCAASDSSAEVYRYKLDIFNSTNVLGATSLVRQVYENSSVFSYNTTLPINQSYSYAIYAYAFKKYDPIFLVNGGPLITQQIRLSAPLLGVFALVLLLTLAFTGIKTGKIVILMLLINVGLLAVAMLNLVQIPTVVSAVFIFIGLIISIWSIKAR